MTSFLLRDQHKLLIPGSYLLTKEYLEDIINSVVKRSKLMVDEYRGACSLGCQLPRFCLGRLMPLIRRKKIQGDIL